MMFKIKKNFTILLIFGSCSYRRQLNNILESTDLNIGKKFAGKVRDVYDLPDEIVIVTTDRLSAFDRKLTSIPFKGYVY